MIYIYKKATNFSKVCLIHNIHKQLSEVRWRPVLSDCGTFRQMFWVFWSPFEKTHKRDGATLRILETLLRKSIIWMKMWWVCTQVYHIKWVWEHWGKIKKMTKPFLQKNYWKWLGNKIKEQLSQSAIVTKYALPYTCTFHEPSWN